jgi:hypothetical protein
VRRGTATRCIVIWPASCPTKRFACRACKKGWYAQRLVDVHVDLGQQAHHVLAGIAPDEAVDRSRRRL